MSDGEERKKEEKDEQNWNFTLGLLKFDKG